MKILASGRIRSFSLLFSDILSLVTALFCAFYLYKHFGAKYEMSILYRTWPILVLLLFFNISGPYQQTLRTKAIPSAIHDRSTVWEDMFFVLMGILI